MMNKNKDTCKRTKKKSSEDVAEHHEKGKHIRKYV